MRLLVVTSQFPVAGEPTRGRPILQTVVELARLAEVRVLSPVARYPRWARPRSYLYQAPEPAAAIPGCEVVHVSYPALPMLSRPINGWLCGRALRAEARAFRPDVILSYWLYPDAAGALRVAGELGVALVAGARGSDIRVRDAISRRLTAPVVQKAGRLLVVSADLGRLATRDYGADPARVRVIANGCDADTFKLRDRAEARAALAVEPDSQLVLYVGRLVAEKGLRELVAATRALRDAHPRAELVLVGDGPLREELAQLARDPAQRLRLAGAQPADKVAQWMAASNLLALPSYSEGHPNVLVEALACGRPVVSCPVGGVPEVVDASCAVLVPPREVEALASALAAVLARDWDEQALSRRFSRRWGEVAMETLAACIEARDAHRAGKRE
ncbi:glycosyltransferase [Dokdonella immobilis]|uniref:Glycosyltransferase involved in cell wall bisynthesis n=1 Tax=Dokdonella immobilis TaxID=578942 RepID=A0A1I4VFW6_9GAMM|nr:glycosyltransferase [Dokdonella immobilis]SFN00114.1 Glycosyltransferase involved in cell wall bisynthesis [Dokdonella immobilis]